MCHGLQRVGQDLVQRWRALGVRAVGSEEISPVIFHDHNAESDSPGSGKGTAMQASSNLPHWMNCVGNTIHPVLQEGADLRDCEVRRVGNQCKHKAE